ncbi:DHA2 family efflux MFS transporter permease subunit [Kribbella sp. NPDC000426]|uniref:DHA2 family efflux MFS transporter permease subunit n=1 Tax=Kribbella sp. NPDC000426 TaxID=3154255 RepID=UPI00332B843C
MPVAGTTRLDPRLVRLALVLSLGAVAAQFDTTIVSVAINRLTHEFGSPLSTIQWVTTAYLLALTATLPLTGWAVARFGVRRMWAFCLVGFGLGSLLCVGAWSAGALIGFRVLQGIGGGMMLPLIRIALAEEADQATMGRLMTFVLVPTQLAPVAGPVLGGLIIGTLDWRWAFLINVPVTLVALVLSRNLVRGEAAVTRPSLDVRGLLLLSPGLAVLIYGLTSYGESSRLAVGALAMLAAGVVLLLGYGVHALRSTAPLFDLRLFRDRSFGASAVLVFIFGGSLFGAMLLLPLYYQRLRGASPLEAGLLLAPQGLGAIVGTLFVGRILDRTGATRTVMLVGLALAVAGTVPFAIAGPSTPIVLLALALVVRGVGLTASLLPSITAAYATLPRTEYAAATTGTRIVQQIGGSLETAVLATVLQRGSFPAAFWTAIGITAAASVGAAALPGRREK